MCEGFVDPASSASLGCNVEDPDATPGTGDEYCSDDGGDIYDYTFENLILAASGTSLSGMLTLPTTETDRLGAADILADPWPSFGPLPRTPRSAEVFNLYGAAVDLLTRARVMLPYELEYQEVTYASDAVEIDPTTLCGGGLSCGATGKNVWKGIGPPATSVIADSGWQTMNCAGGCPDLHAFIAAGFTNGSCYTLGGGYSLGTIRQSVSFRFSLTDPDAVNAIPGLWRDLFTSAGLGTMFCVWRYDQTYQWDHDLTTDCDGPLVFDCGFESTVTESLACQFIAQQTVDFGPTPLGGIHAVAWSGGNQCTLNPERHWYARPIERRTLFITVPLDWEEPTDETLAL
jgi:hypothetical protein